MSLKISKDNVQDLSNAITPFVEKAISYARPICDNVIQNPQIYNWNLRNLFFNR